MIAFDPKRPQPNVSLNMMNTNDIQWGRITAQEVAVVMPGSRQFFLARLSFTEQSALASPGLPVADFNENLYFKPAANLLKGLDPFLSYTFTYTQNWG